MKSYLLILFVAGSLLLAAWGGWDYAKGRLDLRRTRNEASSSIAPPFDLEEKEQAIKRTVYISTAKMVAGCLGIFMVIYTSTRRKNYLTKNYNNKNNHNP